MGLNDLDRANLFKPYFKSSSAENIAANPTSNGIGLNTCKRLANVLNGDLYINNTYRSGC